MSKYWMDRLFDYIDVFLTLPPEAVNPSKHFDPLASLFLETMDFNLK